MSLDSFTSSVSVVTFTRISNVSKNPFSFYAKTTLDIYLHCFINLIDPVWYILYRCFEICWIIFYKVDPLIHIGNPPFNSIYSFYITILCFQLFHNKVKFVCCTVRINYIVIKCKPIILRKNNQSRLFNTVYGSVTV